jgi:hypothetical protein
MPGIWTSAITQEVSLKWLDRKKSSAEANVWTMYPSDLTRLSVVARTDASSSTTAIMAGSDKRPVLDARTWSLSHHGRLNSKMEGELPIENDTRV